MCNDRNNIRRKLSIKPGQKVEFQGVMVNRILTSVRDSGHRLLCIGANKTCVRLMVC